MTPAGHPLYISFYTSCHGIEIHLNAFDIHTLCVRLSRAGRTQSVWILSAGVGQFPLDNPPPDNSPRTITPRTIPPPVLGRTFPPWTIPPNMLCIHTYTCMHTYTYI